VGSIPRAVQDDAAIYDGGALERTCDPEEALQSFALIMIVNSKSEPGSNVYFRYRLAHGATEMRGAVAASCVRPRLRSRAPGQDP
jgi:hypothetical protein